MSKKEAELVVVVDAPSTRVENEGREHVPTVGHYYWYKHEVREKSEIEDDPNADEHGYIVYEKETLCCIGHIGSNYASIDEVGAPKDYGSGWRIHFDIFWDCCRQELDPDGYIDSEVARAQKDAHRLMLEVQKITQQLSVGFAPGPGAQDTMALQIVSGQQDVQDYKKALIRAKQEELPAIFENIKEANMRVSSWMKAKTFPLRAQSEGLKKVLDVVDNQIFNVELYAGLVEEVTKVADGAPANPEDKIHLIQRRVYMDEECLYAYQAGGMEFKNIFHFDKWLARPKNMKRILPFPRTIAAFRVRRVDKERETPMDYASFIRLQALREADKRTFLYVRNGDQLYRLETELEFDEKLFPDTDHHILKGGLLYAEETNSNKNTWYMISAGHYEELKKEHKEKKADHDAKCAAWDALTKEEQQEKQKKGFSRPWYLDCPSDPEGKFEPFTPESVYYDDIGKAVSDEIRKHNRIVVIVQGLLDRSETLLPHPPWTLWSEEGFRSAIELIYDDDRALTPGAKPDFEAFRAKLNASLATGSVTIGQEDAWERAEAEKENERRENNYRSRNNDRDVTHFRPDGNPGPGFLATVHKYSSTKQQCTFAWQRHRQRRKNRWSAGEELLPTTFTCDMAKLINVSAYKKGDYRQFFADPRTRADYLEWAPLLLACEEYLAGNLKLNKSKKDNDFTSRSALTAEELAAVPVDPQDEEEKADRLERNKRFFGKDYEPEDDPEPAPAQLDDEPEAKDEPAPEENPYEDEL